MSAEHSLGTAKDRLTYLVEPEIESVAAEPAVADQNYALAATAASL